MSASRNSSPPSISPTRSTAASTRPSRAASSRASSPTRVTLKAEFEHSGILDEVGGTAYLAQLLSAMVGIINAGEYGRAIHDAWLRRQLIDLGETVVNRAFGTEAELEGREQVEAAEQALFELATRGGSDGGFVTFERALTRCDRRAPSAPSAAPAMSPACPPGCAISMPRSAACIPPTSSILAGRPGMGKSALATKIGVRRRARPGRGSAARRCPTRCRKAASPSSRSK